MHAEKKRHFKNCHTALWWENMENNGSSWGTFPKNFRFVQRFLIVPSSYWSLNCNDWDLSFSCIIPNKKFHLQFNIWKYFICELFQFHMWSENFICEINIHGWMFHFTCEIRVSYTKISHVEFWTSTFHMWIKYLICENVRMHFMCEMKIS